MSRRGLPNDLRMRHDAHYVDELTSALPTPVGRLISTTQLHPNPEQPRVEIGDLSELTSSIADKGVLEPLLVRRTEYPNRWMIIAGERRWRAATAAGLAEVPCVELDVDDSSVAEIALIENLQRKDLTIWEEADGLLALCNKFGYTHEEVSRKVGKSRTSITEVLAIANLPKVVRENCRNADISSKSLILEVVRQPTEEMMFDLIRQISQKSLNRDGARAARRAMNLVSDKGRAVPVEAKTSRYSFKSPNKGFELAIKFNGDDVSSELVVSALKRTLEAVETERKVGLSTEEHEH